MSESHFSSERSYDSDDSEYNLSLATSTLAILKSKTMEILAITMGRQGRTIACNSQLKLSSNEYISFRDLPLLYKKNREIFEYSCKQLLLN